jgi:hypothetical protein
VNDCWRIKIHQEAIGADKIVFRDLLGGDRTMTKENLTQPWAGSMKAEGKQKLYFEYSSSSPPKSFMTMRGEKKIGFGSPIDNVNANMYLQYEQNHAYGVKYQILNCGVGCTVIRKAQDELGGGVGGYS